MDAITPAAGQGSSNQQNLALPDAPGIEAGWEILTVEDDRVRGKFTAEALARNEAKRDSVVRMLGEGLSISAVARAHGMSRNTILAASRRWGGTIEHHKQEVGALALDVARLSIERIRDEIDDMPKASLPIIAGVMIDKAQLLSGAPTARVEHVERSGAASFNDWLDSVVNVTPQPVGPKEESAQKAPSLEGAFPGAAPADSASSGPSGDMQSLVLSPIPEVSRASLPISRQIAPAPASVAAASPSGGGGSDSTTPTPSS